MPSLLRVWMVVVGSLSPKLAVYNVLNAAARLVTNTHDQVRPWPVESILHDQLHWLNVPG